MKLKAFLSHKREDADAISALRQELCLRGIGGWQDTADLPVGQQTKPRIQRVIKTQTGGFIWWGTPLVLGSAVVNKIEVPAALKRKRRQPEYPLVPLFVDLAPGADGRAIKAALGRRRAKRLLGLNGVVRDRTDGETIADFVPRAAAQYAADAIASLKASPIAASFTTFRTPEPGQDLVFDWRSIFDEPTRTLEASALDRIDDALARARAALQSTATQPHLVVDLDLPMPLAYLVGLRWSVISRLRVDFRQLTGATEMMVAGDGEVVYPVDPPDLSNVSDGPVVVAVSAPTSIIEAARRYADEIGARHVVALAADQILEPPELRGLARATAATLKGLSDLGVEKHLLIRGPAAVAGLIGTASNAAGWTVLPFWCKDRYVNPLRIGC